MAKTSKIIIKKYPNRRLYNTQTSTYIKLDDLTEMVRRDEDFKVVDVKTDEDLTRVTLAQIILDHESQGYELLPVDLIKTVIKFYDHPVNKLLQDYFTHALKSFNESMDNANVFNQAMTFGKDFEQITRDNMDYFNQVFFGDNGKGNGKKK